jgi:hypothetical protein
VVRPRQQHLRCCTSALLHCCTAALLKYYTASPPHCSTTASTRAFVIRLRISSRPPTALKPGLLPFFSKTSRHGQQSANHNADSARVRLDNSPAPALSIVIGQQSCSRSTAVPPWQNSGDADSAAVAFTLLLKKVTAS